MNRAMSDSLYSMYSVDYVGPLNPKTSLSQHCLSKAFRILGLGGDFFPFPERRLESIREMVEDRLSRSAATFVIFHGFTPWMNVRPPIPNIA